MVAGSYCQTNNLKWLPIVATVVLFKMRRGKSCNIRTPYLKQKRFHYEEALKSKLKIKGKKDY